MKTVYIPKGETVHYESLTTEHLVVHGRLHVTYGVKAQSITGSGVIDAGSINADTVCIDDVESGTVICKRLIAKRVQAPEVFASESAAVSCFLSAAYTAISAAACARKRIAVSSSRYQRHRLRQLSFSYCKSISARWLSSTGVYLKFSRCHIRKSMLPSVSNAEKNLRQKSLVKALT